MKKITRTMAFILAIVMIIAFSGCGKSTNTASLQVPEGEVSFPETLTVFCRKTDVLTDDMKDYNDVYSFKLLEEVTGTHLEWTIPPATGFTEKLNLMIAGGNLTDIVIANWSDLGVSDYIEDEILADISPYVKEYMPNFWNFSKENPDLARDYMADGGKVYTIPYIRQDQRLNIFYGPLVRIDWLEKLNLEVPTTADELYNVLKAFKSGDPNGNGQADEIPMTLAGSAAPSYLYHMFNTTNGFYQKDGVIKYGPMEADFKDALSYVTKLYAEGLLDVDYIVQDRTEMLGKITNDKVGFAFEYQPTQVMSMANDIPGFKFEGIPNLKDKRGIPFTLNSSYTNSVLVNCSAAITSACKEPFGAMKWLDFIYGEEGHNIMNFGKEGDTYNMVDGVPKFTEKILNNPDPNVQRSQIWNKNFGTQNSYFPARQDWNCYGEYLSEYGRAAVETWADGVATDMNLPALTFTDEQKEIIKTKFAPIETYVAEQIDKIILGQANIEKLPELITKIESMGIDDVIKVYQEAYNAHASKNLGF